MTDPGAGPRVVVGVDGSSPAEAPLLWAAHEAARRRALLHVVHVIPEPPAEPTPMVELPHPHPHREAARRDAADVLHAAERLVVDGLGDQAPPTRIEVREGDPGHELVDAVLDADLLVVGTHGGSALAGLLLGSVATRVVTHAHCPVVAVPSGPRARATARSGGGVPAVARRDA